MKISLKDDTVQTLRKTSFGKINAKFASLAKSLRSYKKTILLITIAVVATLTISSLISVWISKVTNLSFPTIGTIRFEGVEGYWDKDLTNKTGPIVPYNWGLIWPGATRNLTLYLRSISNVDTNFTLTETGWTFYNSSSLTPDRIVAGPSNKTSYMWMTWDYDNSTVHPFETRQVTLYLHANSTSVNFFIEEDVQAFSFSIYIRAVEQTKNSSDMHPWFPKLGDFVSYYRRQRSEHSK